MEHAKEAVGRAGTDEDSKFSDGLRRRSVLRITEDGHARSSADG